MKDLPLFTELTHSEQEIISGGTALPDDGLVFYPDGTSETQCGDKVILPNGTIIYDNNCSDDPQYRRHYPFPWPI